MSSFIFTGPVTLLDVLLVWTLILSVIALVLMGIDKAKAKRRMRRTRESTFGLISLLGGFPGVILGGVIFHHKTSKAKFWIPVIVALVIWDVLFLVVSHVVRL